MCRYLRDKKPMEGYYDKILIILMAIVPIPAFASAWHVEKKQQIRTRHREGFGQPGSSGSPYVIVNKRGQKLKVLRPRYYLPLGPEPEYQPGDRRNPIVVNPYGM